jgi:hypothetical protein
VPTTVEYESENLLCALRHHVHIRDMEHAESVFQLSRADQETQTCSGDFCNSSIQNKETKHPEVVLIASLYMNPGMLMRYLLSAHEV